MIGEYEVFFPYNRRTAEFLSKESELLSIAESNTIIFSGIKSWTVRYIYGLQSTFEVFFYTFEKFYVIYSISKVFSNSRLERNIFL